MAKSIDAFFQEKVAERDFGKLIEIDRVDMEIRKRVLELMEALLSSLSMIKINHPIQEKIISSIKERCEYLLKYMREDIQT